jgi:dihydrofolate reductase
MKPIIHILATVTPEGHMNDNGKPLDINIPEELVGYTSPLTEGSLLLMGRNTWAETPTEHLPPVERFSLIASTSYPEDMYAQDIADHYEKEELHISDDVVNLLHNMKRVPEVWVYARLLRQLFAHNLVDYLHLGTYTGELELENPDGIPALACDTNGLLNDADRWYLIGTKIAADNKDITIRTYKTIK